MHRFYIKLENIKNNRIISLSDKELEHMKKVLRLSLGDIVVCFDGQGIEYNCKIIEKYNLEIIDYIEFPEKLTSKTIIISAFKFDHLEWALEKITEIGIDKIIITKTRYSQFDLSILNKKIVRFQELVIAACKQCERVFVPGLEILKISEVMNLQYENKFIASTEITDIPYLSQVAVYQAKSCVIFIGPEGGFEKDELTEFIEVYKFRPVKLSDNILRSETACIVSTYELCKM